MIVAVLMILCLVEIGRVFDIHYYKYIYLLLTLLISITTCGIVFNDKLVLLLKLVDIFSFYFLSDRGILP